MTNYYDCAMFMAKIFATNMVYIFSLNRQLFQCPSISIYLTLSTYKKKSISLSLSLSHFLVFTHTHTRNTHTQTHLYIHQFQFHMTSNPVENGNNI